MHAALIGSLGLVRFRDVVFAHDTWVSFRRFFASEALGLLMRLGPRGARADVRWATPAHGVAVIRSMTEHDSGSCSVIDPGIHGAPSAADSRARRRGPPQRSELSRIHGGAPTAVA